MIDVFISVVATLASILSLPGSLTLALLSLAALWPSRVTRIIKPAETGRIAIVIPAHNESASIGRTLSNVLAASRADTRTDVWVIADNCDDDTAQLAQAAGAHVIVRSHAQLRGKGHALEYAFAQLTPMSYSWLMVIDADSTLEPGFLPAMRAAMSADRNALQACYLSTAGNHLRSRVSRLAQWGFNLVRPLARQRLGFSCGLMGNGFALRTELLERLPYRAHSVVEDLEYHLLLVNQGERVHFVADAVVTGEIADTRDGARTQRTRWEGGRLRMLQEHLPSLLRRSLRGDRAAAELLADLLLLPLGMHVVLLLIAAMLGGIGLYAALIGLLAIGLYVSAILWRGPTTTQDLLVLACSPVYLIWKLTLLPATLLQSRRRAHWVRSRRNNEIGINHE
ncbi:MAG: glycosyltransferase family 2 protein [Pseudohongiella sp.]|nr:glycosyltransferase family 2 protein [Pseudohongiella sp.]